MDKDLEEDFKNNPVLMEKIKDKRYAQNVYAALCNMRWQPEEVWPILTEQYWSCSWRSAGGIVATFRVDSAEDYMNWYCSGIENHMGDEPDPNFNGQGYVPEGEVTDEIRADFASLGWHPSPWPED